MEVIYAQTPVKTDKPSIFLAGPTPRDKDVPSWRPDMLEYLRDFDGYVFVPEFESEVFESEGFDYDAQVEWEHEALSASTTIIFWIPRDMATMPALTTNDEWGYWKAKAPEKLVLGFPKGTDKVRYQEYWANKLGIPLFYTMGEIADYAKGR